MSGFFKVKVLFYFQHYRQNELSVSLNAARSTTSNNVASAATDQYTQTTGIDPAGPEPPKEKKNRQAAQKEPRERRLSLLGYR